jgi:hypothetical protein
MDTAKTDTLFVKFSEPVKWVTVNEPFYFLDQHSNKNYTVYLKDISQPESGKMVFYVTSLVGVNNMEDGDSVWIHETGHVCDKDGNYQNNYQNIRRRLYVKRILLPYTFVPQAVSPVSVQSMATDNKVPKEIADLLHLPQNVSGMIIMVVPDPKNIGQYIPDLAVKGTLTILDALGNTLVKKEKLAWWDQRKSLVWVWNLKNRSGRVVGSGMYECLFEIEDITKSLNYDNHPKKQVKKLMIGVKK